MLRKYAAVIASVAMLSSSTMAFANSTQQVQPQQGALAPGNAAGVEKATALSTNILLLSIGVAVVAGGVALALSHTGSSNNGNVSTTSTN